VIGVDMEVVSGNGRIRASRHLKFPRFLPSRLSISQGPHSCCFLGNTGKKFGTGSRRTRREPPARFAALSSCARLLRPMRQLA
jgi:hypothetical protein